MVVDARSSLPADPTGTRWYAPDGANRHIVLVRNQAANLHYGWKEARHVYG
jgi:hypothetical protein